MPEEEKLSPPKGETCQRQLPFACSPSCDQTPPGDGEAGTCDEAEGDSLQDQARQLNLQEPFFDVVW